VTSAVVLVSNPLRREGEVSDKNRRLEAGLRLGIEKGTGLSPFLFLRTQNFFARPARPAFLIRR
jgi:hypothetical protein